MVLIYVIVAVLLDWNSLHIKYDMGNNRFDNPLVQLILSLFGSFVVCVFAQNIGFGYYLSLLGKHTIVGYCLHSSVGYAVIALLFNVLHLSFLSGLPYLYSIVYVI